MKILTNPDGSPMQQGSVDWMIARSGIPTASEFDALVTPEFEIRKGEMPKTYLAKKLAEAWQGGPLLGFNMFDMDQGKILEEEAIPWFELEFDAKIDRVGLITTDDGRIGCSPDGLIEGGLMPSRGIEIKCPRPETHVGYLLKRVLPKDYAAQVHGAMFVTGFDSWTFLSYRRHFPPLIVTVHRDIKIQGMLELALHDFLEAFDHGMKKLIEINGGPPTRRPPVQPLTPVESDEYGITP